MAPLSRPAGRWPRWQPTSGTSLQANQRDHARRTGAAAEVGDCLSRTGGAGSRMPTAHPIARRCSITATRRSNVRFQGRGAGVMCWATREARSRRHRGSPWRQQGIVMKVHVRGWDRVSSRRRPDGSVARRPSSAGSVAGAARSQFEHGFPPGVSGTNPRRSQLTPGRLNCLQTHIASAGSISIA